LGRGWAPHHGDSGSDHESEEEIILESSGPVKVEEPPLVSIRPPVAVKIKLPALHLRPPQAPEAVRLDAEDKSDSSSTSSGSHDDVVQEPSDDEYIGDGDDEVWVPGSRKRRKTVPSRSKPKQSLPKKEVTAAKPASTPKRKDWLTVAAVNVVGISFVVGCDEYTEPAINKAKPPVNGLKRLQAKLKALSKKRS
jgi:hypothetical protein